MPDLRGPVEQRQKGRQTRPRSMNVVFGGGSRRAALPGLDPFDAGCGAIPEEGADKGDDDDLDGLRADQGHVEAERGQRGEGPEIDQEAKNQDGEREARHPPEGRGEQRRGQIPGPPFGPGPDHAIDMR